jgi:hypothetical protein
MEAFNCPFETVYVVQAGCELTSLLSQPHECWDYRRALPHLALNHIPAFYS